MRGQQQDQQAGQQQQEHQQGESSVIALTPGVVAAASASYGRFDVDSPHTCFGVHTPRRVACNPQHIIIMACGYAGTYMHIMIALLTL